MLVQVSSHDELFEMYFHVSVQGFGEGLCGGKGLWLHALEGKRRPEACVLAGESLGEHAAASPAPMGVCGAGASQVGCKGCKPRIETPAGYEGDVFL